MACGRPVLCFDHRPYSMPYSDGYLDHSNIYQSLEHNCSGRKFQLAYSEEELEQEIFKYDSKDGLFLRKFSEENLDIRFKVDEYFHYALKNRKFLQKSIYHLKIMKALKKGVSFKKKITRSISNFVNKF